MGKILRLLDADSFDSDFYGKLLIVTFEMEKVGGAELAGDDAEEVRYFPIAKLPRLAFSSNDKAVRFCAAAHEEEIKGSVEVGKLADLAVWSEDPYTAPVQRLWQIPIEMTLVGGEIVHQGGESSMRPRRAREL